MTLKVKGKTYPVSFFKVVLADPVADNLEYIRATLGLANNIEAFSAAINVLANTVRQKLKEQEEKSIEAPKPS